MTPAPAELRLRSVREGRLLLGPETLQINLRNGCNLNCDFCWNHSPLTRRPPPSWHRERLSDPHIDAILSALPRLAPERVLLSGRGEPLLHPRVEDLLEALAKLRIPVTVQTNGIAGPSPERLAELGVARLLVNVSAATPEAYELVHPGRGHLFHDVVRRMSSLARLPRAGRPEVRLLAVIHQNNRDQAAPMVELAAQLDATHVVLKGMEHRDDLLSELRLTESARAEIRASLERAAALAAERSVRLDDAHLRQVVAEERVDRTFSADLAAGPCYMGFYYLRVTVDGRVMFCCKDKEVDHLDRRALDRIWRSAGYHLLRVGARDSDLEVGVFDDKCKACSNFTRNVEVHRALSRDQREGSTSQSSGA